MVVRVCRRDEVPSVLLLWAEAAAPGGTDDESALSALLDRDQAVLLGAEVDGRLVGTLIAAWDGWRGNLYRLAVHPDHRRRGIAEELVRSAEEALRARGARRITALVEEDGGAAVAFWRAAGYRHDERMGRFVRDLDG